METGRARTVVISLVLSASACGKDAGPSAPPASQRPPVPAATLTYPVGILLADHSLSPVFPAGRALPALYSETFATSEDNQTSLGVAIGQSRPGGVEKLCDLTVTGIPPRPKASQTAIVTIDISPAKQLTIKVMIQSTGESKGYGPFPVE